MSNQTDNDAPPTNLQGVNPIAAGQLLSKAREKLGHSIGEIAAVLRILPEHIEALEAGQIDRLPNLAFARALASSVCRQCQISPQSVLEKLPLPGVMAASLGNGISTASTHLRKPSVASTSSTSSTESGEPKPVNKIGWMIGTLLVIGVLIFLLWTNRSDQEADSPKLSGASVSEQEPRSAQESQAPDSSSVVESTSNPSASPVVNPMTSAITQPSSSNSPPSTASEAPVATPVKVGAKVFAIKANHDVAVHVRELSQKTVFNRLVKAGENISVEALPPVRVTIGRVDAVNMQVDGQNFDLTPHNKANVARFVLK